MQLRLTSSRMCTCFCSMLGLSTQLVHTQVLRQDGLISESCKMLLVVECPVNLDAKVNGCELNKTSICQIIPSKTETFYEGVCHWTCVWLFTFGGSCLTKFQYWWTFDIFSPPWGITSFQIGYQKVLPVETYWIYHRSDCKRVKF